MTDTDLAITSALERLFPVTGQPDWQAVMTAANVRTTRSITRWQLALAFAAIAFVAVSLATPPGAAIAHGLGGFSNWITGQPGKPASPAEQQRFSEANARSWLGFPEGTKLRQLITIDRAGARIGLYGFRTGTSAFCLRLTVRGKTSTGTIQCAPLADLKRADAPVRVLIADQPVGRGTKTAWYGIDKLHSSHLQITAGIAADSVRRVVLHDDRGPHVVPVTSNAFLYVAVDPEVGQRVTSVSALTTHGLVSVPFVPEPFGFGGGRQPPKAAPTVAVQAPARNGHISWLEQRLPRGEPLSVLPARLRSGLLGYRGGGIRSRMVYGRVVTPDPSRPVRIAVTLNAHRHGGPVAGLCTAFVTKGGSGGGCAPYPQVFAKSPLDFTTSGGGSAEFVEVSGVASDAVARITALLANGQTLPIALHDNVFDGQIPIAHLPARLVSYNAAGKVVGASDPVGGFAFGGPSAAGGKATQLLAVKGPGDAHAELLVGAATGGGECLYVRTYFSKRAAGVMISCHPSAWAGPALQLGVATDFVYGRVRSDITKVRVDYRGGGSTTLAPNRGYVLATIPSAHLARNQSPARFVGLTSTGRVIATQAVPLPPKPRP